MNSARYRKVAITVGLAALALAALATKAQNAYQGSFTLPVEVTWSGFTLPAGDYTFTLPSQSSPYTLYIHGNKANAIISAVSADAKVSSHAQLDLVNISDVHVVKTFEAPELGVTFAYFVPKQNNLAPREIGHKSQPQTEPATQVSQNNLTIAVHTSGR
jgi:hypothetical protein